MTGASIPNTLVGYVRVSRVAGREGERFISPGVQRERIEAFAAARGFLLGEVFVDLDQSGGKLRRPALDQAIGAVESGAAGGIIVAKVDRFARSLVGALQTIERVQQAGGVILSAEGDLDTSTPTGKMVARIMLTLAEYELDRIRDNWSAAQSRAVARGVHIASRTPTGYRRKDDGRLEPDSLAGAAIRELFRRRGAGESWSSLSTYMNGQGIVGPYDNSSWTSGTLAAIVSNRVYLGEARSGEHRNVNAHEPLVTLAEWEAAQSARPGPSPRNGDGLLLAGLVRCGGCRYVVKSDHMRDRNGSRLELYRCRGNHPAGRCPERASVLARVLDPYVEQRFLVALGPDGPLAEAAASTEAVDQVLRLVEQAERELTAYRDANVVDIIGPASYRAGLEARADTLAQAREQLADARNRSQLAGMLPELPVDLADEWSALSLSERRKILSAAIDAVVVFPTRGSGRRVPINERTLILWRGLAPVDLPRRGLRVPLTSFPRDEYPADVGVTFSEDAKPGTRDRVASDRR